MMMAMCRNLIVALLVLISLLQPALGENRESFWGAEEHYAQKRHLRYLLLPPTGYDPRRKYELWVNLHGDPGCASHAIFQYREAAQRQQVFLLAPEATDKVRETYVRPDGKRALYRYWFMLDDQKTVWAILDEVVRTYNIDRRRIPLCQYDLRQPIVS